MAPSTSFLDKAHSGRLDARLEVEKEHGTHEAALVAAQARFAERNPRSRALHDKAVKRLPGGNTRTILHTAPFPLSMKSGEGYHVTDEDGHTWVLLGDNI